MGRGRPPIDKNRTSKKCGVCQFVLPIQDFCKNKSSKDGTTNTCGNCWAIESAIRLMQNRNEYDAEICKHNKMIARLTRLSQGFSIRQVARMEQKNNIGSDEHVIIIDDTI